MTEAAHVLFLPKMPIRIYSEANGSHGHWRTKALRRRVQRETVAWFVKCRQPPPLPVVVTLVRIAPKPLDEHDNLRIGFKSVVDEVALWLGAPDNDKRIEWKYGQRRDGKVYGVEISFTWAANGLG